MITTAILINGTVLLLLILSFFKDRQKTRQAIKSSLKTLIALAPAILAVILLIGLIYGFFADKISLLFGASGGLTGFFLIAIIGSIIHLPALLAFPLAGSFWAEGATVSSVAVFITTLTMIGFVTLPLEIKTMGKKFAIYRNLFSFIFALVIALLMGVIL